MSVLQRGRILEGDALTVLRTLPDHSVDTIVTSPPYFRLRDYGVSGQLGLEPSVDDWVAPLREVLRECTRVMVPTGTVWLNVGDSYSTHLREGAHRKSLLLGPERLALTLIADDWIIRNKIIWAKTNTVPTSVRDRFATKHEVIYMLTRSPQYFFDLDEVRQPHVSRSPKPRAQTGPGKQRPSWLGPNSDSDLGLAALHAAGLRGHPLGKNPGDVWSLSVSSYRGAHFATYPPKLIERILQAGCPERRCQACRCPYTRPLKRRGTTARRLSLRPSCDCQAPSEPGIVLDPFMGAGSTAVAAEALGRDWLGIELNAKYRQLALDRIQSARSP